MRFLIAFVALVGYASASAILAPLALGATAGDVQAAAINAAVVAQDTTRAVVEGQTRAAEAAIQYNTEAARQVAETSRDINQNAYWNGVAASQNLVAAAQSQAAAIDGAAAAVRAAHLAAPVVAAPIAYGGWHAPLAGLGVPALGLGYNGLAVRAW